MLPLALMHAFGAGCEAQCCDLACWLQALQNWSAPLTKVLRPHLAQVFKLLVSQHGLAIEVPRAHSLDELLRTAPSHAPTAGKGVSAPHTPRHAHSHELQGWLQHAYLLHLAHGALGSLLALVVQRAEVTRHILSVLID